MKNRVRFYLGAFVMLAVTGFLGVQAFQDTLQLLFSFAALGAGVFRLLFHLPIWKEGG